MEFTIKVRHAVTPSFWLVDLSDTGGLACIRSTRKVLTSQWAITNGYTDWSIPVENVKVHPLRLSEVIVVGLTESQAERCCDKEAQDAALSVFEYQSEASIKVHYECIWPAPLNQFYDLVPSVSEFWAESKELQADVVWTLNNERFLDRWIKDGCPTEWIPIVTGSEATEWNT